MNIKKLLRIVLVCAATNAVAEDGNFMQYDRAGSGSTLVAVHSVDNWQFGGVYGRWGDSGKSMGVSLTQRVQTLQVANSTLQLRMGVNASRHQDAQGSTSGAGLKLAAEYFASGTWGRTYALVEASSVFKSWLGVVQYTPANSPVGLEWSAVGDDRWYVGQRVALGYAIEGTPWSVRVGRQLGGSGSVFVGLTYNTF